MSRVQHKAFRKSGSLSADTPLAYRHTQEETA